MWKCGQILHYFALLWEYSQRHTQHRSRAAHQVLLDNTTAIWISQQIYSGGQFTQSSTFLFPF